jgi:methylmalonyl-CoA/ethylmalonyl-CoA epimerase
MRFDHLGVVVSSLALGRSHLSALFGITQWTREFDDPINRVLVQFGSDSSGMCYEIIAPRGEESPVSKSLRSGNRILNHVAYLVPDLRAAGEVMAAQQCVATAEPKPAIAYGGRKIQFYISPLRFMVEFIEAPEHRHDYLASAAVPG